MSGNDIKHHLFVFQADLCDSIVSLQQIDWCVQHHNKRIDTSTDKSERDTTDLLNVMRCTYTHIIESPVVVNNNTLKEILLKNCECSDGNTCNRADISASKTVNHVTIQCIINAFCHPNVISTVKSIILKQTKS